jgi:hypothetical protein
MPTQTPLTVNRPRARALIPSLWVCLSCGGELLPVLARLGSLRCHSCRANDRPLDPNLVHIHLESRRPPGATSRPDSNKET